MNMQRGVVLIISLMVLVLISLVAAVATRQSVFGERMASGALAREYVRQGSESALVGAEQQLRDFDQAPAVEDATAAVWIWTLDGPAVNANPWWQSRSASWWSGATAGHSNSITLSGSSLPGLASDPRYVLELASDQDGRDDLGWGHYGQRPSRRWFYRITAQSQGLQEDDRILLQSIFAWRYD